MIEYWRVIIGIAIGTWALYFLYVTTKGKNKKSSVSGWIMWGPLWPFIDDYFKKRGGLTRREEIGWFIVFLTMLIGIFIAILFPTGLRGG